MAYATSGDLAAYVDTVPANADLLLDRATRDVNRALLTSVFDITDTDTAEALKVATCEQVAGNLAAGVTDGIGSTGPTSFTLGKLSVNRGGGGSTPASQARKVAGLWEQAWMALQEAGLTGQEPWGH